MVSMCDVTASRCVLRCVKSCSMKSESKIIFHLQIWWCFPLPVIYNYLQADRKWRAHTNTHSREGPDECVSGRFLAHTHTHTHTGPGCGFLCLVSIYSARLRPCSCIRSHTPVAPQQTITPAVSTPWPPHVTCPTHAHVHVHARLLYCFIQTLKTLGCSSLFLYFLYIELYWMDQTLSVIFQC